MSKILITGSRGVVGSWLDKILKEDGHDVFGIDLMHAEGEVGFEHQMADTKFTYARCDISEMRQLERIVDKIQPEFVYHCAAEFGRWNGEDFYEQVWRTNAIGTKNIIRLQEKYKFKLVHFSSSEVYGDYDKIMCEGVMDDTPIKQMNDYAMSKWVNEMQINNSRIKHGTETVIVRLFNTYGVGEWYHPYRSVNSKFCHHALNGLPVTVYRGHYRTSTYLYDTCRALANIVKNFKDGEIYNIGGTEYHDIETIVDIIWEYTGADRNLIKYRDSEVLTTRSKLVNIDKAVKDLGLTSTVKLKEGIIKTINWMKNENISNNTIYPSRRA